MNPRERGQFISRGWISKPASHDIARRFTPGIHICGLQRTPRKPHGNHASQVEQVPAVTLGFWIVKIIATTLGETAGDAVSMTMQLGYAVSSIIFIGIFLVAVSAQIAAKSFHPFLYWAVIVATTTAGTTMADFADRSLGIGYAGGAAILFMLLMASLLVWYLTVGSISVTNITSPKVNFSTGPQFCFHKPWARH